MQTIYKVLTPAAGSALTTIDRVKLELGIVGNDANALLFAKINEASSDIEGHVGQVLRLEGLEQVFWGMCKPAGALVLGRAPVVEVTAVLVDGEALASEDFDVDAASGLLYRLGADGVPTDWVSGGSVVVTYSAGYVTASDEGEVTLPAAIEAATVELVSGYWASRGRDPNVREVDVPGVMRTVYWVGAVGGYGELPPNVASKLTPYRRVVAA